MAKVCGGVHKHIADGVQMWRRSHGIGDPLLDPSLATPSTSLFCWTRFRNGFKVANPRLASALAARKAGVHSEHIFDAMPLVLSVRMKPLF